MSATPRNTARYGEVDIEIQLESILRAVKLGKLFDEWGGRPRGDNSKYTHTDRQIDRQTDRQRDRERESCGLVDVCPEFHDLHTGLHTPAPWVDMLSGGELQRVGLARVLYHR